MHHRNVMKNERGFTLLEMLLVLAITMIIVTVSSVALVKAYETTNLERYAIYFELKLREMQAFALEHEVNAFIRFVTDTRQIEYFYVDQQGNRKRLYLENIPPYVTNIVATNTVSRFLIMITPQNGAISGGLGTIQFYSHASSITYNMGLERGKMWRNG